MRLSTNMAFLRDVQDNNETLFYALAVRNVEHTLPLVCTATVAEGCLRSARYGERHEACLSAVRIKIESLRY